MTITYYDNDDDIPFTPSVMLTETPDKMKERIARLECENRQLRAEIARLQNLRTFTDTEAAAHGTK